MRNGDTQGTLIVQEYGFCHFEEPRAAKVAAKRER